MRRRELMLLLGAAMMSARALRAQHKAMPVIGFLSGSSPGLFAPLMAAVRQGLSETGYVEGQNVAIEYRWAEGHYDRLPDLAADLIARNTSLVALSHRARTRQPCKAMPRATAAVRASGTRNYSARSGLASLALEQTASR
jgi:putative ABC transport system substrate-binding protein